MRNKSTVMVYVDSERAKRFQELFPRMASKCLQRVIEIGIRNKDFINDLLFCDYENHQFFDPLKKEQYMANSDLYCFQKSYPYFNKLDELDGEFFPELHYFTTFGSASIWITYNKRLREYRVMSRGWWPQSFKGFYNSNNVIAFDSEFSGIIKKYYTLLKNMVSTYCGNYAFNKAFHTSNLLDGEVTEDVH